jgi:hypothetical protein
VAFILKNDKGTRKFGFVEKIEWCEIIKTVGTMKNIFAKKLIQELKVLLPKLVFACPLIGKIELIDIATKFDFMDMMPKGLYIIKMNAVDKPQEVIINATSTIQLG